MRKNGFLAGIGTLGLILAVAGCQSSDSGKAPAMGAVNAPPPPSDRITEAELRAYCPSVTLRSGTAFYTTYAGAKKDEAEKDPKNAIYQASITDVTRSCTYNADTLTMNVAAAGKVVTGPKGSAGTVTMPIRVAVVRGDEVLYSQLHKFPLAITDTSAATQFVFNDPAVTIPTPTERNIQVFVGYDEGPPARKK